MNTNKSLRMIIHRLFLLLFLMTLVPKTLCAEPIGTEIYMSLLQLKAIQMKVGIILENEVFAYDDFQKAEVTYPKPENVNETFRKPPESPVTHNILQWFVGDLETKTVRPAPLPTKSGHAETKQFKHTEFRLQWDDERIQRWCYKDDFFWCVSELLVQFKAGYPYSAAYNELFPAIYRTEYAKTKSDQEIDEKQSTDCIAKRFQWNRHDSKDMEYDDLERMEWIPAVSPIMSVRSLSFLSADEKFQCFSKLPVLLRPAPCYDYLSGGFDFLPISRDHWQFCTLIPLWDHTAPPGSGVYYPFTLWDAHSITWEAHPHPAQRNNIDGCEIDQHVKSGGLIGHENRWKVFSQSLLAWGGKFFAVPIRNVEDTLPKFHLIRDSYSCHELTPEDMAKQFPKSYAVSGELYRLEVTEEDKVDENCRPWHLQNFDRYNNSSPFPEQLMKKTVHCKEPVLDPETHRLIAIIYMEPEGKVYGFGKDFYVRLDVLPENDDMISAIVPCRDVTQGTVSGPDTSRTMRPLADPFRTVWECSLVLKEDGVNCCNCPTNVPLPENTESPPKTDEN